MPLPAAPDEPCFVANSLSQTRGTSSKAPPSTRSHSVSIWGSTARRVSQFRASRRSENTSPKRGPNKAASVEGQRGCREHTDTHERNISSGKECTDMLHAEQSEHTCNN